MCQSISLYNGAEMQMFLLRFRAESTRFSDIEAWQLPNCRALFCFILFYAADILSSKIPLDKSVLMLYYCIS